VYTPEVGPDAALPLGSNSTVSRPTMEIRLEDERLLSREVDCVPGDRSHSVARDALEATFCDCMSFVAVSLAPKKY
jgi:hypothetical protein